MRVRDPYNPGARVARPDRGPIAEFSELFDGFSIGSNDLAQLTLGVDRDSAQDRRDVG